MSDINWSERAMEAGLRSIIKERAANDQLKEDVQDALQDIIWSAQEIKKKLAKGERAYCKALLWELNKIDGVLGTVLNTDYDKDSGPEIVREKKEEEAREMLTEQLKQRGKYEK